MRSERGSTTFWVLGLSVVLLLFGGLAIDFWRGLAVQRNLAAVADSAVVAAASGIDEEHYRSTGEVILDPSRAVDLAAASVAAQEVGDVSLDVTTGSDGSSVTVVIEGPVELGLLGLFVNQDEPLTVRATAVATPLLIP